MPSLFSQFYGKNRFIVSAHIVLILITFPIEIGLLSYISGQVFQKIQNKQYRAFFLVLLVFFGIFLFIQVLYFLQDYINGLIIPRLDTFTRTELLNAVLDHRFDENDELKIGELMHRLSKSPGHIYKNYFNDVNYVLPLYFTITFFCGYLFFVQWRVGLLMSCLLIGLSVVYFVFFNRFEKSVENRMQSEHEIMDLYQDAILNHETIRMTNRKEEEKQRIQRLSEHFEGIQKQSIHQINLFKISVIVVFNLFLVGVLLYAIYLSTSKNYKHLLPFWRLIVLITAVVLMSKTGTSLIGKCIDSVHYKGSVRQFQQFIEQYKNTDAPIQTSTGGATPTHRPFEEGNHRYDIAFRNVSFRYPSTGSVIFRGLDLTIPYGKSVLILGTIGSGKSTLFKMILNQARPTTGVVSIGGVPIGEISILEMTGLVSYMNQSVTLFNRTVAENIFYGIREDREALARLNVPSKIVENLDTVVGKQGSNFSGGEKQIMLMLRAYFRDTPIVLLDEPTANLDPKSVEQVMRIVRLMMKTKTVICITHDTALRPYFETVYELKDQSLHRVA